MIRAGGRSTGIEKGESMSLAGRVALVTGGGRGIGEAIALALAEDGADIAVNYRRDDAAAKETVAAIEALERRARSLQGGGGFLRRGRRDGRWVSLADFGHIDILVNNAGIASRGNSVLDTDPAELERVVRIHALGPHYLCQLVLPSMRTAAQG